MLQVVCLCWSFDIAGFASETRSGLFRRSDLHELSVRPRFMLPGRGYGRGAKRCCGLGESAPWGGETAAGQERFLNAEGAEDTEFVARKHGDVSRIGDWKGAECVLTVVVCFALPG